eukprot:14022144-Heterocapsa_arctica.AAC.1
MNTQLRQRARFLLFVQIILKVPLSRRGRDWSQESYVDASVACATTSTAWPAIRPTRRSAPSA